MTLREAGEMGIFVRKGSGMALLGYSDVSWGCGYSETPAPESVLWALWVPFLIGVLLKSEPTVPRVQVH